MVPDGLATVVSFALLVAPGLVHTLARERRLPGPSGESAFREIGRTVLASTVFSVVAGLLLWWPAWLPALHRLAADSDSAGLDDQLPLGAAAVATAAVACGLALAWDGWLARRRSRAGGPADAHLVHGHAWYEVVRRRCPPGNVPIAWVTLTDGSWWKGQVVYYTLDPVPGNRDLVLQGRLVHQPAGANTPEPVDESWRVVVLNGSSIATLRMAYGTAPAGGPDGSAPPAPALRP